MSTPELGVDKIDGMNVVVLGGSGFVGSHLVARLSARGVRVLVPTRRFERAKHLIFLARVEVIETDIYDDAALARLLAGADAVINLVGTLYGKRALPYGAEFARVHVDLARRVVSACAKAGIKRYLHMSALGAATAGPSMYLRSKADGELAARGEAGVAATIIRPSVIFGPGDQFLNMFAAIMRWLPVLPLPGADADFQPVYVGDVAQAFVNALSLRATRHGVYDLGGPAIYTLGELVRYAGSVTGHRRPVLSLPAPLARLQALFFELLPGRPLFSRDNLDSMSIDNVVDPTIEAMTAASLGLKLTALEAVAPHYLATIPYFDDLRSRAGR